MPDQKTAPKAVTLRHIVLTNEVKNTGSIIKLDKIPIADTVLSPEFQKYGGVISFNGITVYDNWKNVIKGIEVPPVPITFEMSDNSIAILHPIAVRANHVAKTLHDVKTNEKTVVHLQRSVQQYYKELCSTLFGKGGIFNRSILGPRLKSSFRAVIIPGVYNKDIMGESYTWVGIPGVIFDKLKMSEGDLVIIGRDPTIWMGSIELLHAYRVDHNAIEIHPIILPQLGGDHDGDQCWGFYPKQDLVKDQEVAGFTRKHAKWGKNFNDEQDVTDIDFGNFGADERARIRTTGLSVGPLEILREEHKGPILSDIISSGLDRVLDYCSKGKRNRGKVSNTDELRDIAKTLSVDDWKLHAEMINLAQVAMKIYMGPVGLLALRLLIIGHAHPEVQESAHMLAERCAQGLLDAKHLTYEQAANFKPAEIFKILNLEIPELDTAEKILKAIQEIIPCDNASLPIIQHILNDSRGVKKMCQELFPLFEGITSTADLDQNGYMPECVLNNDFPVADDIVTYAFVEGLKCSTTTLMTKP